MYSDAIFIYTHISKSMHVDIDIYYIYYDNKEHVNALCRMPLKTPKITGQEHFRPELHSCDALPVASPVLEEGEVTVSEGVPESDGRKPRQCEVIPKLFWIRVSSFSRNS